MKNSTKSNILLIIFLLVHKLINGRNMRIRVFL